jgi:hypothetical protein
MIFVLLEIIIGIKECFNFPAQKRKLKILLWQFSKNDSLHLILLPKKREEMKMIFPLSKSLFILV